VGRVLGLSVVGRVLGLSLDDFVGCVLGPLVDVILGANDGTCVGSMYSGDALPS